ncbi:MAG TPA: 4-(cytidine 5'-diphospho)-2-C-methyl-D-erythritol kinase [Nitrospira sp.]|nr:4-(cytidine 5'-diphospho)-2-C-methyl-D-erythritol kinase [Nitrospira sp.]
MTKESASRASHASLTVHAPAKVNVILRILDRRPDGYHNLWSIMQTLALEDSVTVRTQPHGGIKLSCDSETLSIDHSNLVWRAASAVLEHAKLSPGLDIELRKRIPMGAGLGGGSSDAAATILGLNRLLHLGWTTAKMAEVGQTLGSDVPFFFFAPSAIVSGRGEMVRPVTIEGDRWLVLVKPPFGIETKWAYQELAATRPGIRPLSADHIRLGGCKRITWSQLTSVAENDFEMPVFGQHARLGEIKRSLLKLGAECALLSGSGATVFGLFEKESTARRAEKDLRRDPQLNLFVVPTCSGPLTAS